MLKYNRIMFGNTCIEVFKTLNSIMIIVLMTKAILKFDRSINQRCFENWLTHFALLVIM